MKKVGLFLTFGPSQGGASTYSLAMLSALLALPKDEFSLVVAHIDPLWREYLPTQGVVQLQVSPGRVAPLVARLWIAAGWPLDRWRRWASRFHGVAREVMRQECDLWVFPSQDFWCSQFPVATLAAVHDLMHRYESRFPEATSHGRYRYREAYLGDVCSRALGVLADSELGRQQVHESYKMSLDKVFVLPYVPPPHITDNYPSPDFDKRYALPPKYIFYPARFRRHKNHARLIHAVAKVRQEFPEICLVLAGSKNEQYREVRSQAEKCGLQQNVLFLGYVPETDLAELYRRARALVMPTFFGPTNIPPLEAFVLGCPVAVSRIYAMPEQVGDAALLFDPDSVEEMASCIRKLWCDEDLRRVLIARGKQKAASWAQPQFNEALDSIVRRLTNQSASDSTLFAGKLAVIDQVSFVPVQRNGSESD